MRAGYHWRCRSPSLSFTALEFVLVILLQACLLVKQLAQPPDLEIKPPVSARWLNFGLSLFLLDQFHLPLTGLIEVLQDHQVTVLTQVALQVLLLNVAAFCRLNLVDFTARM